MWLSRGHSLQFLGWLGRAILCGSGAFLQDKTAQPFVLLAFCKTNHALVVAAAELLTLPVAAPELF